MAEAAEPSTREGTEAADDRDPLTARAFAEPAVWFVLLPARRTAAPTAAAVTIVTAPAIATMKPIRCGRFGTGWMIRVSAVCWAWSPTHWFTFPTPLGGVSAWVVPMPPPTGTVGGRVPAPEAAAISAPHREQKRPMGTPAAPQVRHRIDPWPVSWLSFIFSPPCSPMEARRLSHVRGPATSSGSSPAVPLGEVITQVQSRPSGPGRTQSPREPPGHPVPGAQPPPCGSQPPSSVGDGGGELVEQRRQAVAPGRGGFVHAHVDQSLDSDAVPPCRPDHPEPHAGIGCP